MRKIFILGISLVSSVHYSQYVGVNTSTPTSTIDITAKNPTSASETQIDGALVPRVSQARAESMGTAVPNANLVFINDLTAPATVATTSLVTATGFYYFDAAQVKWIPFRVGFSDNDWHTTGNAGTTVGTNFLGTTDAMELMFKVNNEQSGFIDYLDTRRNVGFGYKALLAAPAYNASNPASLSSGNVAFGYDALSSLGSVAGQWQTQNTAVGDGAMKNMVSGAWNTAIGMGAMGGATGIPNNLGSMRNNVALGNAALHDLNNGGFNLAIGPNAMSQAKTVAATDAIASNIAMGLIALNVLNNGTNNIAMGFYTANNFRNGSNNVMLGTQAGLNATAGNQNIFIGHNAMGSTPTTSNEINIGQVLTGTGATNSVAPAVTKKIGINMGNVLPNSTLQVGGSVSAKIRTLTTGTVADDDYTILVRGNISLPAPAAANTGRIYNLIQNAAGNFTITGSFSVGGSAVANYVLNGSTNGTGIVVQSSGTSWIVISRY